MINRNKNKGFAMLAVIVIGLVLLGGVGYLGYTMYRNNMATYDNSYQVEVEVSESTDLNVIEKEIEETTVDDTSEDLDQLSSDSSSLY